MYILLFTEQLVSKDLRTASLESTAYLSPASAVLAAAAAAAAETNGTHEDHIKLDSQVVEERRPILNFTPGPRVEFHPQG
jgi:hypothetical protein